MEQYTVQKGDSLWKISRKFGIDVNELANINGLLTKADHILSSPVRLSLPSKDKVYDTQLTLRICDPRLAPAWQCKTQTHF
ncbi:LysM peptidoglycan-binding domain-containing protein [Klebsiella pneumoniae]|uniref:LysM peptidoglycan-binding domain-containing protein n=1 Tax=Klebsiella pneumoniae TaxID=573 RepID=A0A939NRF7_KLEPN|nr:LysM peptidoglycan-binding domain-containing protein [Klebsiella pneumoniae]